MITVGAIGPALTGLRRLGDEAQLRAHLRFSVSDDLGELRRAAGHLDRLAPERLLAVQPLPDRVAQRPVM
jgi:hypothetical protein